MESNRATYCLLQSVSCATQRLEGQISRHDSGDLFAVGTLLVASDIAPVFDFKRHSLIRMSFALRGLGFLLFLILYPPLLPPRRRGFFRGFVFAIIIERQPTEKDFCDPLAADGVQRRAI